MLRNEWKFSNSDQIQIELFLHIRQSIIFWGDRITSQLHRVYKWCQTISEINFHEKYWSSSIALVFSHLPSEISIRYF